MCNPVDLELVVPAGSGNFTAAETFIIEPSTDLETPWITKTDGVVVDSLVVDFKKSKDGLTTALQTAIFIVSIPVNTQPNLEGWTFYGNGIEVMTAQGNCQYTFASRQLSPTVLEVTISQVSSNATSFKTDLNTNLDSPIKVEMNPLGEKMEISFRYVMQYTGGAPSENGLYMSQDPRVGSRR